VKAAVALLIIGLVVVLLTLPLWCLTLGIDQDDEHGRSQW
jgi:hypothetical protein